MTGLPRVIAHRGAKHACPENTHAAFEQALAEGADGIELDLRLSADGVPVVFHDHTLRKLGQARQRLSALTLAELRRLDFGGWFDARFAGEPIPTLAEVLVRYAPRTELCLELKTARDPARNIELVTRTLQAVREAGAAEAVWILCFDAGLLRAAHARAPRLRYVLNALGPEAALRTAAELPWLHGIDVDIRWLTPAAGAQLRAGGRALMSYTCNTEAQLRAACAAGAAAVITNRPAWARAWLRDAHTGIPSS
jgi:glycerophosphoryl diester phosphodiesterase